MDIERAALERVVKLGELYDVRCDKFLGKSLLTIDLNDDIIDSFDLDENDKKSVTIIESNKFTEKSESLGIDEELQTSIVSGCVDITGVHEFLLDNHNNKNEMSLIYRINTIHKELVDLKSSKDCMNVTEENIKNATHVTVGIDYGALCIVTCHYTADDTNLDEQDVENKLRRTLNSFKDELQNGIQSAEIDDTFVFTVRCDLTLLDFPSNIEAKRYKEAVNFIREIVEVMNGAIIGKGVPQVYHLKPLDRVKQMCRLTFNICYKYKRVDKELQKKCLKVHEEFQSIDKELTNLMNEFPENDDVCTPTVKAISEGLKKIKKATSEFKERMQVALLKIRSGEENIQIFESRLEDFTKISSELQLQIESIHAKKSDLLKLSELNKQGFKIIASYNECSRPHIQNGLVLYTQNIPKTCTEQNETFQYFRHLFRIHHQNKNFYIASLEMNKEAMKNKIYFYEEGKIVWDDVFEMIDLETNCCVVNLDPHPKTHLSTKKAIVKTMFDNKFFTEPGKHQPYWFCDKCGSNIEYGLDTKLLYCRCGESNPKNVKFLMNDLFLYSHDLTKLSTILDSLPQSREINILVLGETGVGKSTWINGIHNYFRYESLSEASQSELFVPIPSKFEINGKTISVGKYSKNENPQTDGEVGTLGPKLYPMIYEDCKVNIIDTPGVGDTRGEEKDKENFNKILEFLSNYDTLHAVCILLKTNSSRMTKWFTFCLDNLLTHLHSSIVKNIVFCFTHAGLCCRSGDTLPVLQKYLAEKTNDLKADLDKNCFVFENESFRYLACFQNGVDSVKSCFNDFDKSWTKTRKETVKLLDYVCHLAPHELKKTISLHSARQSLLMLEYPLATIVDTLIPENIRSAEKITIDLCNAKDRALQLERILEFKGKSLEMIPLDYPRTVCTNVDCTKTLRFDFNDSKTENKYNVCHENCRIDGLQANAVKDKRISKCEAFHCYNKKRLTAILGQKKANEIIDMRLKKYIYKCENPNCREKDKIMDVGSGGHHHERFVFKRLFGYAWKRWNLSKAERSQLGEEYRENCFICNHSYRDHMHETYELQLVDETFIDPVIHEKFLLKSTDAEIKKAILQEINQKVQDLREEKGEIYLAQARFSVFIEMNSLVPMKDTFEDFIQTVIDREQKPLDRDSEKLREIQDDLGSYKELKRGVKEEYMLRNVTPEEIVSILNSLKMLKHTGQIINTVAKKVEELKTTYYNAQDEMDEEGIEAINFTETLCASKNEKKGFKRKFRILFQKLKCRAGIQL